MFLTYLRELLGQGRSSDFNEFQLKFKGSELQITTGLFPQRIHVVHSELFQHAQFMKIGFGIFNVASALERAGEAGKYIMPFLCWTVGKASVPWQVT